VIKTGRFQIQM